MATAQCRTCHGIASGETFGIAKTRIDHAIGLRIGRPCSGNEEAIEEIIDESVPKSVTIPTVITEPKKVEVTTEERPKKSESTPVTEKPKKHTKLIKKPSK